MESTQTTTVANTQDIQSARLQWGTDISTKDGSQSFNFAEQFGNNSPAVIVNRTQPNATAILPVTSANNVAYTIDRASSVDGDQYFNMLSIGSLNSSDVNSSDVLGHNGSPIARIQWGVAETTTDSNQSFPFPETFSGGCYAVLTNRKESNGKSNLPVVSIDTDSFTVNRPTSTNGNEYFYWIAIGNCAVKDNGVFSFQIGEYTIKGGMATSSSDSAQTFSFNGLGINSFAVGCDAVVTTRTRSGSQDILPVTDKTPNGFTIDRDNGVDGSQSFYWVAIGK